jgi:hypothetical protein
MGFLMLSFEHLLSKINFGIIAETATKPYIQSLYLINAGSVRSFDFVDGNWKGDASVIKSYSYYDNAPSGGAFEPSIKDEVTPNAIYFGTHSNHLMFMPQSIRTIMKKGGAPGLFL